MEHKTNNNDKIERMARDLIEFLMRHPDYPKKRITELKNKYTKKYNLGLTIKNSVIIKFANKNELPLILTKLRRRSTRSISGVTVVAVMTKPMPCPGNCIYCPGEKSQPGEKAAKSYTGREPAARRSIMYHYDPFLQTYNRLKDLAAIGHNIDKVELIIMGGTFLSTPLDYQKGFIMGCFEAIKRFGEDYDSIDDLDLDNEHNNEVPYNNDIQHYQNISNIREQYKNPEAWNKLKTELESSNVRLVGVTIETRPDFCYPEHINRILDYGGTRVEIGVQTTREDLLKSLKRGHTIEDTINSFRFAKDSGLKINAHMMPMLPGSTIEEDYNDFKTLFENPDFRPDMLKIYPTLVVEGTELYEMWSKGEYKPYDLEELINLLARIKSEIIPKYVRIQRVQRDIPAYLIKAGVKKSNLRQLVQNKLKEMGRRCNCIRCREVGFINKLKEINDPKKWGWQDSIEEINKYLETFKLERLDYEASKGKEIFLSYENKESLAGYLRLRIPSERVFRPELKEPDTLIIREIRVVGELVPHNSSPMGFQIQHRGLGKKLLREAERIAREEFDAKKLAIISGIGVRQYFYKQGYKLDGVYVSKSF